MLAKPLTSIGTMMLTLALAPVAIGQDFDMSWYTIDGGGEMFCNGGNFELSGTIGQPDANAVVMTGGDFELVGGFWAVAAAPCDPCDMNCDELINSFDIEPFIALLFDPKLEPCCGERGVPGSAGDTNGDGLINSFDIEGFLDCLFGP